MTRCGPKPPPMLPVDERNAIVTDHARLLYTIARDFRTGTEDIQDLAQEIAMVILIRSGNWSTHRGKIPFPMWLRSLATSTARAEWKRCHERHATNVRIEDVDPNLLTTSRRIPC